MTRSRSTPLWLRLFALLALAGYLFLWFGDPGDEGMRNVFTFLLTVLVLTIGLGWYVLLSGAPGRRRAGVAAAVVLVLVALRLLVRIEGVGGTMIPELAWSFDAPRATNELVATTDAAEAGVDLGAIAPTDFPGFLGPRRDNLVTSVVLEGDWSAHPPELLWRRDVGAGWSGFAVVNGVAVTMEQGDGRECITAYRVADGERLWVHGYPGRFDHFLGGAGPRATPTIAPAPDGDGGRVYALGAEGRLTCLEGADGSLVWERDLFADYGIGAEYEASHVAYGRSSSPLVHDGLVIVPVGGDPAQRQAGLAAFDAATGEPRWESAPHQTAFASPTFAVLAGREQVLIVLEDVAGGYDPTTGATLWETEWPGTSAADASSSQPVPIAPDRVLLSKGYGVGAALLELVPAEGGRLEARTLWHERRALRTKFTNLVVHEGHAYGLSDGILECVELESGRRRWREGRFGHGQILGVGRHVVVLGEEGELVLLAPTPEACGEELGRVQALEGKTWNHLALAGEHLLVRNGSQAACYRLALASAPGS